MDARELRRQIETLERRQNFLGQRVAQRHRGRDKIGGDEGYDRAEFKALGTAIKLMEEAMQALPPTKPKGQIKEQSK